MKSYLVGGAVRDQLLNIPVKDKDWVIVGATPKQLIELNYQQVGADFPVFLHPETKEEYALARTERKSGIGYKGFEVSFDASVTLEEDLIRRDLTINAIAQDDRGNLIDPYGGQKDLNDRVLRHVSPAFREDPLRVLRIARFSARFAHLGFTIADETQELLIEMSNSGELRSLVAERVWSELSRALIEKTPSQFFYTLRQSQALSSVFPELDKLFGVPQPMRWHPEIDTGVHTLLALDSARNHTDDIDILFATLCHDLGKGLTPKSIWPSHHGHEGSGADLIKKISKTYKWPIKPATLAENVARYHTHCHKISELKPSTILKLLNNLNGFRNPNGIESFTIACKADAQGRTGLESINYPQKEQLIAYLNECSEVTAQQFVEKGLTGKAIGEAIANERINRIKNIKNQCL
jgi:tRNA nucleotidyltransferase (CCA-adding enzyme)